MRREKYRFAMTLLSTVLVGTPVYATTPSLTDLPLATIEESKTQSPMVEVEASTEGDISETVSVDEQHDLQEAYQAYLASLEAEAEVGATLSAEEEAAGYQIIDGIKYAPEELIGDVNEEVNFGGVQPNANTGYVNFFTELPEYIHENAYVVVMNLNTGEMYGCRTYEINGFQAQICIPSGIYMITEGGLSMDTTGRFYVLEQQFQVKRGGQQTVVAQIVDSKPELAEKAYPENQSKAEMNTETEAPKVITESGITETMPEKEQETEAETEALKEEGTKEQPWYLTLLLTLGFSLPCVIGVGYILYRYLKNRKE